MTEKTALNIAPAAMRGLGHLTNGVRSLDLPLLPLAIGGALAVPYFARKNSESEYNVSQRFNDAQARGEAPMSDSFDSFVQQRRKHGQTKEANMKIPAMAAGGISDVVGNLLNSPRRVRVKGPENLVPHKANSSVDIDDLIQNRGGTLTSVGEGNAAQHFVETREFDPAKATAALGGLGGLGALGVGYNALTTAPDNPLQHKIQDAIYGPNANVRMGDEFLKGVSHQGGKETAGLVRQLVEQTSGQAADAAKSVPRGHQQSQMLQRIMGSDDLLRDATPQDQELLGRAYQTMQKFAPELASDEFAARNYLRESLMAANGPDYATISNLARANRDITDQGRRR